MTTVHMERGEKMSKYVKLEDALRIFWELDMPLCDYKCGAKQLESLPTIDIVRCKECRWYNPLTKGCCRNPCVEAWYDNDFCSYGERIEE